MEWVLVVLMLLMSPCEYEDSDNCNWNASVRGNGVGHSFINLAGHIIYY